MRRLAIAGTAVAVAVLPLASAAAAAAPGWSIQHTPNPAGASDSILNGVSCASVSACTAVGQSGNGTAGVTLAEGWNGTKWSIQHTPNPTGGSIILLQGVSCTSASACTAVGDSSNGTTATVTLAERWNGTKWSIQHTPNPSGSPFTFLYGVSCTSASACTAVGDSSGGMLAEGWNGTKWSIQHTPNPTGGSSVLMTGVSCTSASACTAVGDYNNGTTTVPLAERWNGTKWSIQHPPSPAGSQSSALANVSCGSASACTAVGSYTNTTTTVTLAESWNGTKWSIQSTPNPTGGSSITLGGVSCTSASSCTGVGSYAASGTTPVVTLAERWNGTTWSIQPTPSPAGAPVSLLNGVSCPSATACTAVGGYTNGTTSPTLAERWSG